MRNRVLRVPSDEIVSLHGLFVMFTLRWQNLQADEIFWGDDKKWVKKLFTLRW
jgi:hypothetical protein